MSNAELIERLRHRKTANACSDLKEEAADALELADKRIAELAKFHAELHVEHGKAKIRIGELERKLAVAREAMASTLTMLLDECNTNAALLRAEDALRHALAQTRGE